MYKVYGSNRKSGWEVIYITSSLIEAKNIANRLSSKEYYSYLIKECTDLEDKIISRKSLFIEDWER